MLTQSAIIERSKAAYLGLAIGDALGATTEFMLPQEIEMQYGTHKKIIGGGWLQLKPGQVTDDTTMALTLGQSLIEQRAVSPEHIAQAYSEWLASKPVDVGNTVRRGIIHFRYSGVTSLPLREQDAGNGAAMRALPMVLFSFGADVAYIRHWHRQQAHTTHNNPLSDAAIDCINDMIHLIFAGEVKDSLLQGPVEKLIRQFPEFDFQKKQRNNPSGYIVETMQAVFQAFFSTNTFESCLIDIVNRGGDADTTGAIAGAIAGAYYGLPALPRQWVKKLDAKIYHQVVDQSEQIIRLAFQRSASHTTTPAQLAAY